MDSNYIGVDCRGNGIHETDTLILRLPDYMPEHTYLNGRTCTIGAVTGIGTKYPTFHPVSHDPVVDEFFEVCGQPSYIPLKWTKIRD